MVRRGTVRIGKVRQGTERSGRWGMVLRGRERSVSARQVRLGKVWCDKAWSGHARSERVWHGPVRYGRSGTARHSQEWRSRAWFGRFGKVWCSAAQIGALWQGWDWLGRLGVSGLGKALHALAQQDAALEGSNAPFFPRSDQDMRHVPSSPNDSLDRARSSILPFSPSD